MLLFNYTQKGKIMNLFTQLQEVNIQKPLAEILRPKSLEEFFGQKDIIFENSPLLKLLQSKRLFSFIFWGPPGCGKTTLARLISTITNSNFIELSACTSGVKEIKEAIEDAKKALINNQKTILFIDEIHRYSKTQQDALLPHLESGLLYLIGSTTENPSFQVNRALLSRVSVIELKGLSNQALEKIVLKGFSYLSEKWGKINFDNNVVEFVVAFANQDARSALNLVEKAYFASNFKNGEKFVNVEILEQISGQSNIKYSIQQHYDLASAFQKSLRGSDKNAAIYYMAQMILAGEDPKFIARRLIVCASEDVGNEDPQALTVALNAYKAIEILGLPEARIALSQAVEYVADAKKSNRAILAIDSAICDIKNGLNFNVPKKLCDSHYQDAKKYGFGDGYFYSHNDYSKKQQFLPDEIKDKKYWQDC